MNAPKTPARTRKAPVSSVAECLTLGQIADRLHDYSLQSLSAARLLLCVAQHHLPKDAAESRQQLKKVDSLLDESCTELTALMRELRTASEKDSPAKI